MAITRTIANAPTVEEERTWRATIETPRGGPYSIHIHRERVQKDAAGNAVAVAPVATPVHRFANAIAGESVTLANGTTISAAAILEALPLFFDRWASEDTQ